jgi:quercetin dioxygenase-like cupin family protein
MNETNYALTPDVFTEVEIPAKGIISHTVFNDDQVKLILFGFAPGQELTAHTAPMPATMLFLQGEANLTLGTDKMDVSPGALIHMQPNLTHGIVAKTPLRMLLTLVKAARQDAAQ